MLPPKGGRGRLHLRPGAAAPGIDRLEAVSTGAAYAPHRHDRYAIGITLAGVQAFGYRGVRRHCLPGQAHLLHPDELHDGGPGTEAGFAYRILYLDPALLRPALRGRALPFVADPVLPAARLDGTLRDALAAIGEPLDEVEQLDLVAGIAAMLRDLAGGPAGSGTALALPALHRAREAIAAEPAQRRSAEALERLSGLDRWSLARQFRAAFGTSPSRFRTLRQLDLARALLRQGVTPGEAALAAGFADQAHMTRQFKRAWGVTPASWAAAQA